MNHDMLLAGVRWLRDKAGGGSTVEPTPELCGMMANSIERQVAVERHVTAGDDDPPMIQHNGHWRPMMAPEMSHADVAGEARMLTHSELSIDKLLKGGKPLDYYCVLVRDRILYLMQRLWAQEKRHDDRVTELLNANSREVTARRELRQALRDLADELDREAQLTHFSGSVHTSLAVARSVLSGESLADPYLVWSNEHRAWWRPNSAGYTTHVASAGRYTHEKAVAICRDARNGFKHDAPPSEVPVREADVLAMMRRLP